MKNFNTNRPGQTNSSFSVVTTSLYDFPRLKRLVEKLAFRTTGDISLHPIQPGWQPFLVSSIEVLTAGRLQLANEKNTADISFISHFMCTCISHNDDYKLTWVHSLS